MTYPTENLTPQLVKPLDSQLRLGQGIIRTWEASTFENTVEWRGQILQNVPVLAGTDALSYRAGDAVVLLGNGLGSGASSWFILGRAVVPGPETGAEVIEFMQSGLVTQIVDDIVVQLLTSQAGQDLAAFVIGQRVHSASEDAGGTRPDNNIYGDLGGGVANPGPSVTAQVSDAGVAVVFMTVRQAKSLPDFAGNTYVGVQTTGATTVSPGTPGDGNSWITSLGGFSGDTASTAHRLTAIRVIEGLNPGEHTFTLKYAGNGAVFSFSWRNITVIAL